MEQQHHAELIEAIGRLKGVVETQLAETHDKIAELVDKLEHVTEVLREQTEEMGALYDAIDDYRELVGWTLRNRGDEAARPFPLTSLPRDAAAADFHERVNRLSGDDLPPDGPEATERKEEASPTRRQLGNAERRLF